MKLFYYQEKGRDFILKHKYVLIGDEMGLGKTIQALSALKSLGGPVLVVCPAMLRYTWSREVEKLGLDYFTNIVVKGRVELNTDTINIVSYEGLKTIQNEFMPRVVIFDEAHYLKNLKAKRTHRAHEFVFRTRPEVCVLLTGTPVKNNVTEFYSLMKLLGYCPTDTNGLRITEKSQYAWNVKFTHPRTRTLMVGKGYNRKPVEITEYHGLRNVEKLTQYFQHKYLRRLAKSVLDLPELIHKDVLLKESRGAKDKALMRAFEEFTGRGLGLAEDEHVSTIKAESALEKASSTASYVSEIVEQGESVVVFTDHIASASEISEILSEKGIKTYCITGNIQPIVREELVLQFQNNEGNAVLVATIGSASTGYTLTKARNLVYNDLPWVPADLQQATKRIHRIGQNKGCVVHYILASKIDAYIKDKLTTKIKHLGKVL